MTPGFPASKVRQDPRESSDHLVHKVPLALQVKKEREALEENLELLDHSDLQERECVIHLFKSDNADHIQCTLTESHLCLQGAPGNRGFPGQDGLAGAKVS